MGQTLWFVRSVCICISGVWLDLGLSDSTGRVEYFLLVLCGFFSLYGQSESGFLVGGWLDLGFFSVHGLKQEIIALSFAFLNMFYESPRR